MLATGGDTALGGDDFDHLIADWIVEQAGIPTTKCKMSSVSFKT